MKNINIVKLKVLKPQACFNHTPLPLQKVWTACFSAIRRKDLGFSGLLVLIHYKVWFCNYFVYQSHFFIVAFKDFFLWLSFHFFLVLISSFIVHNTMECFRKTSLIKSTNSCWFLPPFQCLHYLFHHFVKYLYSKLSCHKEKWKVPLSPPTSSIRLVISVRP